jgi:chromosome segregation ATPase
MNKFVLMLVLVSGFLSGYLIGDYRGRDARETLKVVAETGKSLESEREAAIAKLRTELENVSARNHRELDNARLENAIKASEWRRTKEALDEKIKRTNSRLAESDAELKALVERRDGAKGSEESRLNEQIAQLRKEREDLLREMEGNTCLQTSVPRSVFDALNQTSTGGGKK